MTYQVDAWTALGDPTRREIFERLVERPRAVVDLAKLVPISRPAVSQHLKVLLEASLVVAEPIGTRRVYRVQPSGLASLRADLERFWGATLASYKELVERPTQEERA